MYHMQILTCRDHSCPRGLVLNDLCEIHTDHIHTDHTSTKTHIKSHTHTYTQRDCTSKNTPLTFSRSALLRSQSLRSVSNLRWAACWAERNCVCVCTCVCVCVCVSECVYMCQCERWCKVWGCINSSARRQKMGVRLEEAHTLWWPPDLNWHRSNGASVKP